MNEFKDELDPTREKIEKVPAQSIQGNDLEDFLRKGVKSESRLPS